jgi:hypothetical protein
MKKMFGPKAGHWWVRSEPDSRWNGSGRTEQLLFSTGPPPEVLVLAHVEEMKSKYGDPPDDLEWEGMKD